MNMSHAHTLTLTSHREVYSVLISPFVSCFLIVEDGCPVDEDFQIHSSVVPSLESMRIRDWDQERVRAPDMETHIVLDTLH